MAAHDSLHAGASQVSPVYPRKPRRSFSSSFLLLFSPPYFFLLVSSLLPSPSSCFLLMDILTLYSSLHSIPIPFSLLPHSSNPANS